MPRPKIYTQAEILEHEKLQKQRWTSKNPDKQRGYALAYYHRNKEAILALKKQQYNAKKDANKEEQI